MKALIKHLLDSYHAFNTTGQGIRTAIRIELKLQNAIDNGEDHFELDESDWSILRDAAESAPLPSLEERDVNGIKIATHQIGRAILPLIDAISGARN